MKIIKKPDLKALGRLMLCLFMICYQQYCTAVTCTWTGSSNTNWNNSGNWDANGIPGSGDDAIIANVSGGSNIFPVTELSVTVASLTINNSARMTIGAGYSFTVSGNASIGSSGALTVNGIFNPSSTSVVSGAGSITGTGTLKVSKTGASAYTGQYANSSITLTNITLEYCGTSSQTIEPAYFKSLIISGGQTATANVDIILSGNLTINSGSTFNPNTNIIRIAGNMTGSGSFTAPGSEVVFNGSTTQYVDGFTFYDLVINNSGTGIVLQGNVGVTDNLLFTNGNVDLGTYVFTLGTATNNTGTLAYTSGRFINSGSFKRWFGTGAISMGSNAGLFPMGTASAYRSFWVAGTPSVGGTISVKHTDASGTTSLSSSFSEGSPSETYALRQNTSFEITPANSITGTFSIRMVAGGIPVADDQYFDICLSGGIAPGTWTASSNDGTNHWVERASLSQTDLANTFYFAGDGSIDALPVELTFFKGQYITDGVCLTWQTASEQNNDRFDIERSVNGNGWQKIGFVNGNNTTALIHNYKFIDLLADVIVMDRIYYRLRQTDYNGRFQYSQVIAINVPRDPSFIFYPNPANDFLNIALPVDGETEGMLTITDLTGKIFYSSTVTGTHQFKLDVSRLKPGSYDVIIETKKNTYRKLLIKY
jgi:hypothetical protein